MLCKPKPCFWPQKLCCNLFCPTTDLGKVTFALCLIFSIKEAGMAEKSFANWAREVSHDPSAWKSAVWMERGWLHPSELELNLLLEAAFLKVCGATLKKFELFKENGWHHSCEMLVTGFCLQLFPLVTRTRGTLSRFSLTTWSPEVTSKPNHAVILWIHAGSFPKGTKWYTRLQIICKVCMVGYPHGFLNLDMELHQGNVKTEHLQCGYGGVAQTFCLFSCK